MMLTPRFVDSRENSRIAPLQRAGFEVKPLSCGDVQFPEAGGSTVIIENKRVTQLLTDMASGQLMRQMAHISEASPFPILLVEGKWAQHNGLLLDSNYSWQQAWNELQSVQDIGVRLQLSTGPEHTITRILELAEYYGKGIHRSVERGRGGDRRIAVLCQIRGIGEAKADSLLGVFGSLGRIARATESELGAVVGLGPRLAAQVYQFWQEGEDV